jgi:hypothetical protein
LIDELQVVQEPELGYLPSIQERQKVALVQVRHPIEHKRQDDEEK